MPDRSRRRAPAGAGLIVLAGLVGAAIALYLFLTPLTGVTGTVGALVVLAACLLVALGGLLMLATGGAVWRWLTVLGIIGTALAAFFLHGWWIMLAMLVALVGVVLDRIGPVRKTQGTAA